MTSPQVVVKGLVKRYGQRAALDGLSFTLDAGCRVALLGPNGAGKSTLFQVLTGLFAADEGDVEVAGPARFGASPPRRWPRSAWCSSR